MAGPGPQSFDFIVVGAGSAGCVLANRLSRDPSRAVLLLEAGGNDSNPMIKVPMGYTRVIYNPKTSNLYKTAPEPFLDGRRVSVPRGRVIGGCSSINGHLYMRGQREDYDSWAALPGCGGWSYDEILPYFKKSEHFEIGEANAYHGKGGELNVSRITMQYPVTEAYVDAAVSIGIPRNDDVNGAQQAGIGYTQVNLKDGKRWSGADAFLSRDVRRRPNLTIETHAVARRVLFEGRRAVGVEYDQRGHVRTARADREVILSAGAYNTPPLLEISGVGSQDALTELGVEPVHVLAGVGHNLQDHYQAWVQHGVKTRKTLSEDGKFPKILAHVLRYLLTRRGPLSFASCNVFAFVPPEQGGRPIFQIHFTPGAGGLDENGNVVASEESGVNSTICVVRPTSRGSVHAESTDPKTPPRIQHNFLSTEHDQRLSVGGFKLQRRIYAAEPFRTLATHELVPGDSVQTDDEILAFWKTDGMSVYHPVGTAKMGDANDPAAVVDNKLRVHGVDHLRVIDASIFPQLPSGNTHAPVVAVAEKGAELILEDAV